MARPRLYGVIKSFEAKALKKRNIAVKIADHLTSFFGSMEFFVVNLLIFVAWIAINTGQIHGIAPFDPYPFILLVTFVSLEAIVLSTIVLMSQSRSGLISSLREEIHLQVNLISEREITKVLQILTKVAEKQGINLQEDAELAEMLKNIDESYIERKLEAEITPPKSEPFKLFSEPVKRVAEEMKSFTKETTSS
ncbi:MAG: DUF1003 domain-containing protein [Patescibacteria group bacterium]